ELSPPQRARPVHRAGQGAGPSLPSLVGSLKMGPEGASQKAGMAARLLCRLEAAFGGVCAALLAAMLLLVLASVVSRYGFSTGFAGAEELTLFLFSALVFLGAPLAQGGALSMRLDLGVRALP